MSYVDKIYIFYLQITTSFMKFTLKLKNYFTYGKEFAFY